jgi:hypothetical protein
MDATTSASGARLAMPLKRMSVTGGKILANVIAGDSAADW